RTRPDGLEPAGGRPAEREIPPRRRGGSGWSSPGVRLSARG
ncbi:hypothetical protein AZZ62_004672, partial [Klebsiella variicola]